MQIKGIHNNSVLNHSKKTLFFGNCEIANYLKMATIDDILRYTFGKETTR